ncbi:MULTISPECIES: FMN-binding negative transcriptional regulator [Rhizobium/Agrobacterium group]|uniref:FMN-binding negative transcriptional regulator n=1 Tax=Rhizobium/Agrobacterium group TaxID=227290 RepID=UPI002301B050|nr:MULTISPECIES: FMN-binding negative transcriptional regulator [Rhizobium/Agrobacterium group]MDA5635935.1 FMN-binding negative transcriptional regulator [Agrobacterium sp. ST15.16.024]MDF1891156.1 FMN-binding negative transcriptional regulator [Rhizobium rhizogenes]
MRQNLLQCLIETFPFAVIVINGNGRPLVARAPLTFRDKPGSAGAIEFHLAQQKSIVDTIADGMPATIIIDGPSAHISPSWYTARFPNAASDRSHTAPTCNYVSATLEGRLYRLDCKGLQKQIADLVADHEPDGGWRLER